MSKKIERALVFVDGELLSTYDSLEAYFKKRKQRQNESASLQCSLYLPCEESIPDVDATVKKYNGTVKYAGIICSRVYIHSKTSIDDAQSFIKTDLLRSLSARLRIYLDAFSITEHEDEPELLLTEPPRRIFFDIRSSELLFSDYLFRGEQPDTVIQTAKEILDVDLNSENIHSNIETVFGMLDIVFITEFVKCCKIKLTFQKTCL